MARAVWVSWACGVVLLAGLLGFGLPASMLPIVAPFAAALLLWLLARAVPALWRWMLWRAHARWHGQHFEFNGRRIRVLADDDALWVVAEDVFDALGLPGRARDAERVRRIAGRDGLALAPHTNTVAFTERGLAAWMERRTDRVAVDFQRWFEREVLAPHRRRRAATRGAAVGEDELVGDDSTPR